MSPDFEYLKKLADHSEKQRQEYAKLDEQNKARRERLKAIDDFNKASEAFRTAVSGSLARLVHPIVDGINSAFRAVKAWGKRV